MVNQLAIARIKSGSIKVNFGAAAVAETPKIIDRPHSDLVAAQENVHLTDFTGDKFLGGFGTTNWYMPDYWTLRARSKQLFRDNLYARGIIRRYVTNIVNIGLMLEATPEEEILGLEPDALADWAEMQENMFSIWAKSPKLCDFKNRLTFGQLQAEIKREALVQGDILVVLRADPVTKLPKIQLIDADVVQTPPGDEIAGKRRIIHGVELNEAGEQIAYHIRQEDGITFKRLAAKGGRTGRRQAWLVYGTDKLHDDVRGEPLLSIILQSLREVDRYRDSAQRKAVINSIHVAYIKKTADKISSLPITGGATSNTTVKTSDTTSTGSVSRDYTQSKQLPGAYMQELQVGEEPVLLGGQGTDINFPVFEEAIISAVAWALEVPPEILKLAFSNNYSASQAALNEFVIFLMKERANDAQNVCQKAYEEWFLSSALTGKIDAPGFLEAWQDPLQYDNLGAWLTADWAGAIKPTTDMLKLLKAMEKAIELGIITRARAARMVTGMKYSKVVKTLRKENEQLAKANEPLVALEQPPQAPAPTSASVSTEVLVSRIDELEEKIEELTENA